MRSLTQEKSSNSVRLFSIDRARAIHEIRKAMETQKSLCPEMDRVVLFGSLARGDAGPGSDADLLVVVSRTDLPFPERFVRYAPAGVGIGVDVFAYTHSEIRKMLAEGNPFIARALSEGFDLLGPGRNSTAEADRNPRARPTGRASRTL